MHHAQHHQAMDRFQRVDGVPARRRNARRGAHRLAAGDDALDHLDRQLVQQRAHQRQRKDGLAAHGVHIRDGVGRGNAAEVERIIDDGREEIGGGDDGLLVVQAIHRRVVAGFGTHQQVRQQAAQWRGRQDLRQHGRRDLAAATTAVAELGESDG